MSETAPRFEMRGIRKTFPGVVALDDVSFSCAAGEIHALCGENGAGKSTLMKVLGGVYKADSGEILLDGKVIHFDHPLAARQHGISIIHQELSLLPDRSVAENIYLGRELGSYGVLDRAAMNAGAEKWLKRFECRFTAGQLAGSLSIAEQQIVEIAKALNFNAQILVMDEPTAALDEAETDRLLAFVRELRAEGVAIVFISHRMPQVFAIADTVTVLKDGKRVGSYPRSQITPDQIVRQMVGRELKDYYPARPTTAKRAAPILSMRGGGNDAIDGIDFDLSPGEIVAIAGLEGSGKGGLARAIYGAQPLTRGTMRIADKDVQVHSPREAIGLGIGYVSDDRKAEGLALQQSVTENALLAMRGIVSLFSSPKSKRVKALGIDRILGQVDVRAANYDQRIGSLSGGNQQKAVLARWLALSPPILICSEPTRGIDVAAKAAIYHLLRSYADNGKAVLVVTSDLPEAIGIADRLVVMHEGRIVGELPAGAREEDVVALAAGHTMTHNAA
ncbi:MAG TPA: sugar ABC transporter ATP-binding protein [Magnetospirillaceae bacterium]|jgi:ribose transport system ATP-binding protein